MFISRNPFSILISVWRSLSYVSCFCLFSFCSCGVSSFCFLTLFCLCGVDVAPFLGGARQVHVSFQTLVRLVFPAFVFFLLLCCFALVLLFGFPN